MRDTRWSLSSSSVRLSVVLAFAMLSCAAVLLVVGAAVEDMDGKCNADAFLSEHGDMIRRVLGTELNENVHTLGSFSNGDGYMERFFLTSSWFEAQATVMQWMKDAGLDVWMDSMGSVHGRTPLEMCAYEEAPVLMLGSHVDSVRDGGKYDGHLGITTALAAVKAVMELAKATDTKLVRPVHVVSFGDEEGTRFFSGFLSSRALIGDLKESELASLVDKDGISLSTAMQGSGFLEGTMESIQKAIADESYFYGFVELHIEQGMCMYVCVCLWHDGLQIQDVCCSKHIVSFLFAYEDVECPPPPPPPPPPVVHDNSHDMTAACVRRHSRCACTGYKQGQCWSR